MIEEGRVSKTEFKSAATVETFQNFKKNKDLEEQTIDAAMGVRGERPQ